MCKAAVTIKIVAFFTKIKNFGSFTQHEVDDPGMTGCSQLDTTTIIMTYVHHLVAQAATWDLAFM